MPREFLFLERRRCRSAASPRIPLRWRRSRTGGAAAAREPAPHDHRGSTPARRGRRPTTASPCPSCCWSVRSPPHRRERRSARSPSRQHDSSAWHRHLRRLRRRAGVQRGVPEKLYEPIHEVHQSLTKVALTVAFLASASCCRSRAGGRCSAWPGRVRHVGAGPAPTRRGKQRLNERGRDLGEAEALTDLLATPACSRSSSSTSSCGTDGGRCCRLARTERRSVRAGSRHG